MKIKLLLIICLAMVLVAGCTGTQVSSQKDIAYNKMSTSENRMADQASKISIIMKNIDEDIIYDGQAYKTWFDENRGEVQLTIDYANDYIRDADVYLAYLTYGADNYNSLNNHIKDIRSTLEDMKSSFNEMVDSYNSLYADGYGRVAYVT